MGEISMERVRLAARLYDARDTVRRLFAERYEEKVEPWRAVVRELMAEWKCGALQVVPRLERDGNLPDQPLLLIAASVDVAEEVR